MSHSLRTALGILDNLELALLSHNSWLGALNRFLICRTEPLPIILNENSHLKCAFGQWFYNQDFAGFSDYPIISDIALMHEKMHLTATKISLASMAGKKVDATQYDELLLQRNAFKWLIGIFSSQITEETTQIDPLTGCFNRKKLESTLEREHGKNKSKELSGVLVIADIDYFKKVNDIFGHTAGDKVLRFVSTIYINKSRPTDLVFRFGGEEFLLYLHDVDLDYAFVVIDRIREFLANQTIILDYGKEVVVTSSFGLALLDPAKTVKECIDSADQALYKAKKAGRNRVEKAD